MRIEGASCFNYDLACFKKPKKESAVADVAQAFAKAISDTLKNVNKLQKRADKMVQEFALGRVDVHDVMIALSQARLALRFTTAVRNQIVLAYQELIRMR